MVSLSYAFKIMILKFQKKETLHKVYDIVYLYKDINDTLNNLGDLNYAVDYYNMGRGNFIMFVQTGVLKIDNTIKGYDTSYQFLNAIKNKKVPKGNHVYFFEHYVDIRNVENSVSNFHGYSNIEIDRLKNIIIWIECDEEFKNCIFIYTLFKESIGLNVDILLTTQNEEEKFKANLTSFLRDLPGNIYFKYKNKMKQINCRHSETEKRILSAFTPVHIVKKQEDAHCWHRSVAEIYHTYFPDEICFNRLEPKYYINSLLARKKLNEQEKIVLKTYNSSAFDATYKLLETCCNMFCHRNDRNDLKFTKSRRNLFHSQDLWGLVRDLPFIAFYIFCMYARYQSSKPEFENLELRDMITSARDMADGILQLIDNAVEHSSDHSCAFCLRIYNQKKDSNKNILYSEYREYFNKTKPESDFFLETTILDYSDSNLIDTFINSLKQKTINTDDQSIKEKYDSIIRELKNDISLFFVSNEQNQTIWSRYNGIEENAAHHYGLELFNCIINSNNGCFSVTSGDQKFPIDGNLFSGDFSNYPGTFYKILVPFVPDKKSLTTGINVNVNYLNRINEEVTIRHVEPFNLIDGSGRTRKEEAIKEIRKYLLGIIDQEKQPLLLIIQASDIQYRNIEVFCKAIVTTLIKRKEVNIYLAILNCEESFITAFAQMMYIYYLKSLKVFEHGQLQIYMNGIDIGQEFILAGDDINEALQASEKFIFSSGINSKCFGVIKNIAEKRLALQTMKDCTSQREIELLPYDLLCKVDGETIFEKKVQKILHNDLQNMEWGCCVTDTHMSIQSKIHIDEFFEAELLFHNNLYTSRFSKMIYDILKEKKDTFEHKNLVLVGYETYSEMLLYELYGMMKNNKSLFVPDEGEIDYIVYENTYKGQFRYWNPKQNYEDCCFILIVPINSTLSTYHNLEELIIRKIGNSSFKIGMRIGIIVSTGTDEDAIKKDLIDDSIGGNILKSKLYDYEVRYLIHVEAKWHDPLTCERCFPENPYLNELPLIKTNRASIVPDQMLGLKESLNQQHDSFVDEKENDSRVQAMQDFLIRKHILRNGNHFRYYIQTEEFFHKCKTDIIKWLDSLSKEVQPLEKDILTFHFIVSPIHFSNTAFIEEVNHLVFHDASLVIYFDTDKEFRDNIKTKYSNINALYQNLKNGNRKAKLLFHYVDDTIISGRRFNRAKSLIKSIFSYKALHDEQIEICVFDHIILLLNRCSYYTKLNFIDNPEKFKSYVYLNVPNMRNHKDACVLCKENENAKILMDMSSTKSMMNHWKEYIQNNELAEISEHDDDTNTNSVKGDYEYELFYAHKANCELNKLDEKINNSDKVARCITEKLLYTPIHGDRFDLLEEKLNKEQVDNFTKKLVTIMYLLSRPFFSYRKSIKEAMITYQLAIIQKILIQRDTNREEHDRIKHYMEALTIENKILILNNVIENLAYLESNFLIRKHTFIDLGKWMQENLNDKEKQIFLEHYRYCLKQLVDLCNDETKSLRMEYMLQYGEEYGTNGENIDFAHTLSIDEAFRNNVFMENVKILRDAVQYRNEYKQESNSIYFQKYKDLRGEEFTKDWEIIVKLYELIINERKKDPLDFYEEFMKLVKEILHADYCGIFIKNLENKVQQITEIDPKYSFVIDELSNIIDDTKSWHITEKEGTCMILNFGDWTKENSYSIHIVGFINKKIKKVELVERLRNILFLRKEIEEKLHEDSKTNAISTLCENLKRENLALKTKAADHMSDDDLDQLLELLHKVDPAEPDCLLLLSLYTNILIGRMNIRQIYGKNSSGFNQDSLFEHYIDYYHNLFMILKHKLNVYDGKEQLVAEDKFFPEEVLKRYLSKSLCDNTNGSINYPVKHELIPILLDICRSATKEHDSSNTKVDLYIFSENEQLVFRNKKVSFQKLQGTELTIALEKNRINIDHSRKKLGEGVSLGTIVQYFSEVGLDVEATVNEKLNSEGTYDLWYEIRLPIFDERGNK